MNETPSQPAGWRMTPLVQLTLARFREFFREPAAVCSTSSAAERSSRRRLQGPHPGRRCRDSKASEGPGNRPFAFGRSEM